MGQITVTKKSELRQAKNEGCQEIVVKGNLANHLKNAKRIAYIGAGAIVTLTAALAVAPITGGLSFFAAAPIAVLTGLEISVIIAVAAVGIALVLAVYKDYDEIEYSKDRLVLKRKSL